jgi:1-acyl-sn-glycerol-3-phosphate acyltransferase
MNPRPPENSLFMHTLAKWLFRLIGWRAIGQVPNVPKFVVIAAPHTTNFDGVLVIFAAQIYRVKLYWMGKHNLFKPPFGGLLRWLGGIPIDRNAPQGAVRQMIEAFKTHEKLILVITPEGTRKRVARWKSGFYFIAQGADVPVLLAYMDYSRREVGLGPLIYPSGDMEADLAEMQAFYTGKVGRYRERMAALEKGS